jgi:hypothetical protein
MESNVYMPLFKSIVAAMDKRAFDHAGLELKVVFWVNSVVLKIQKPAWRHHEPFVKGIFFSVWVNDTGIGAHRIYYNIHALKMRELAGYKLKSREFAAQFRTGFKPFENDWPNVSTAFGPLTLMEGWVEMGDLDVVLPNLALKFISIQHLIDDLLQKAKV